jgi:basic membrane protein A
LAPSAWPRKRVLCGSAPSPARPRWPPGIVVANQVYHWTVVLRDIFNLIAEGTYSGQAHAITLENRGLVMEYNADYALAGDVKTLADETVAGIIDGTISTGTGQ